MIRRRLLCLASSAALCLLSAAFCLLLVSGAGSILPIAAAQTGPAYEVIQRVNDLRASLGLPLYQIDSALMAAAQSHAEWMAANYTYSHTGAGGSSPQDRATAAGYRGFVRENVGVGTNETPAGVVYHWGQSPGHYPTMASTQYTDIGAGYARNSENYIYVLLAGYTSSAAPSRPSTAPAAPDSAAAVAVPVTVSQPHEDGSVVHVVQTGQTAWDIAAVYGVDLAELLRLNNLPDDPLLQPGDEILVRPPGSVTPRPSGLPTYVVQSGDTAWTIAAHYGVDLQALLTVNDLGPDPLLHPGDELVIPLAANSLAASPPPPISPTPPQPTFTAPASTPTAAAQAESPTPPPMTPSLAPSLIPTPQPSPTPVPAADPTITRNALIGVIIIAVGMTVFAAMLMIELYERFVRRRE